MKKKWKLIGGAVFCVLLLFFGLYGMNRGVEAELLEVEPQSIAKTFEEEGKVVAKNERPVYPLYGGKIERVVVTEGEKVNKGDVLAVINSKELQYQLEQLRAELRSIEGEERKQIGKPLESQLRSQELQVEKAQLELDAVKKDFWRIQKLFKEGAISEKEYQDAEKIVETAQNHLQQQREALSLLRETYGPQSGTRLYYKGRKDALKAQIEKLQYQIDKCTVVSPLDGVVADLTVEEGDMVTSNTQLMKIFRDGEFEVEVYVLTEDIGKIKSGMRVELALEREGEDIKFEGRVQRVAPTAVKKTSALGLEEERVKVTVIPEVSEELDLHPGSGLDVEFTVDKRENKLVVPKTALFSYGDGDAVWVVRNGKAEVQQVEKGFENDTHVVIENGLKSGDKVILNPQLEGLEKGKKVVGKQVR